MTRERTWRRPQVVGVFPFLGVDSRGSTRQSFLRGVSQVPQVMAAAGAALGLLPQGLRHSVIRLCGGEPVRRGGRRAPHSPVGACARVFVDKQFNCQSIIIDTTNH